MRFARIYSIILEGTEADERGGLISFEVLAKSAEEAVDLLMSSGEVKRRVNSKVLRESNWYPKDFLSR